MVIRVLCNQKWVFKNATSKFWNLRFHSKIRMLIFLYAYTCNLASVCVFSASFTSSFDITYGVFFFIMRVCILFRAKVKAIFRRSRIIRLGRIISFVGYRWQNLWKPLCTMVCRNFDKICISLKMGCYLVKVFFICWLLLTKSMETIVHQGESMGVGTGAAGAAAAAPIF